MILLICTGWKPLDLVDLEDEHHIRFLSAAHNLKSALISAGTVALSRAYSNHRTSKVRRYAMRVALEVNFALWIMIGCGVAEYLI